MSKQTSSRFISGECILRRFFFSESIAILLRKVKKPEKKLILWFWDKLPWILQRNVKGPLFHCFGAE